MHYLTLSFNKIDEKAADAISQCLRNAKLLYVDRCGLSENSLNQIAKAIGKLERSVGVQAFLL